jgi:hypothetical protein
LIYVLTGKKDAGGDKRAPSGFMGMRGKKEWEDYPGMDWGWSDMTGLEDQDQMEEKRGAPSGFFGVRGKKGPSSGFFGMRGKKGPSSSGFFGMRGKKGPSGFMGVRGKKSDTLQIDALLQLLADSADFRQGKYH